MFVTLNAECDWMRFCIAALTSSTVLVYAPGSCHKWNSALAFIDTALVGVVGVTGVAGARPFVHYPGTLMQTPGIEEGFHADFIGPILVVHTWESPLERNARGNATFHEIL